MSRCLLLFAMICTHGIASWYGPGFDGRLAADGSVFHQTDMTAASLSLPLGTVVEIANLDNGRVVRVVITDRGPFVPTRVLDLSSGAAVRLGFYGLARVEFREISRP